MRYLIKVGLYCVLLVFLQVVVFFVAQGLVSITSLFPPYSYMSEGLVTMMGHTILSITALVLWLYNFPDN